MKTNNFNSQSAFLLFLLLLSTIYLSAQETNTNNKLNFKLGYSKYKNTDFTFNYPFFSGGNYNKDWVGNIRISSDYKLNKFIDVGIYFSYSLYQTKIPYSIDSIWLGGEYVEANSIMYGLNSNIHLLPFFIKKDNFRFDLYCSLQFGGIHLFEPEGGVNTKKNYSEYGVYGGLAFYPFKHLGLYMEYGFAKYADLRYGLSLKF